MAENQQMVVYAAAYESESAALDDLVLPSRSCTTTN